VVDVRLPARLTMKQRGKERSAAELVTSRVQDPRVAAAPGVDVDGVGSPEHLRATFGRAAAAADRAVGLWLARRFPAGLPDDVRPPEQASAGELQTLRALARASATAYARQLRADGTPPERMLVLVKLAAGQPRLQGFGARELTNDLVRWSIEAYYDD
jgi:hypothetical protein